jgi:CRP/FNR family transcriptional regulator, cyclic AMP receptor protein
MDAEKLKAVPLFADMSPDERRKVAQWADEIEVDAGKELIRQHGLGHEFFAILEGTASVTDGDRQLAELVPGDFFGEVALLESERRTANVTSTSPMKLVVMSRSDFLAMSKAMPDAAANLRATIAGRLSTNR